MAIRDLTAAEQQRLYGKRKPRGQRPRVFNAVTRQQDEISEDFETFIILMNIGFRARIGQYLTAISTIDTTAGTMNSLRREWLGQRKSTYQAAMDSYGPLISSYEDIREKLVAATIGFEEVPEIQRLLTDFSKVVGGIVDVFENTRMQWAMISSLDNQATSSNDSSPVNTELNSMVSAFLSYS